MAEPVNDYPVEYLVGVVKYNAPPKMQRVIASLISPNTKPKMSNKDIVQMILKDQSPNDLLLYVVLALKFIFTNGIRSIIT
jgi:hypothetical protein